MTVKATAHIGAMSAFALANFGGFDQPTLAQNESAFAPSPKSVEAGRAALARSHLYPDPDWTLLRDAIARIYRVERDLVLCGAGSMDLIACIVAAFAGPGAEVLGTDYAYNFIASAAARVGASYIKAEERDFTVSIDAVLAAVTPATRIVFICNPGNPTGTCIRNGELLRLRAALPGNVLLVIDQAYGEFDDQDPEPIFALATRGDTVVLRSLSKAYGLAGARVGWGLFAPRIAAEVRKMQNSNQITTASLAMAVAAIEDQAYMRATVASTAIIRDQFVRTLRAAGYAVPESRTNFVLVRFPETTAAEHADKILREAGIVARGLTGYGLTDCLRITIGPQDIMDRTLGILTAMRGRRCW